MKPGKTLQELAIELDRQNSAKQDFLLDTRNLVMDADENGAMLTMIDKDNHVSTILGINDIAHSQIGTSLGIPKAYYDKMLTQNPALLAENVNAWFNNEPEVRMLRTMTDEEGGTRYTRAFLSRKYRRIDHYDLAQNILPILKEFDVEFASTEITGQKLYIKVVNEKLTREVKPGDYVQSGLIITNSEVGMGTLTIQPLLYRLVCTNGMVVNDFQTATKRRHIGRGNIAGDDYTLYADDTLLADDRALMLKIRDTIKASLDEVHFVNLIDNMRTAADTPIEARDIPGMVKLAAPTFGYTLKESEGILDHLIRGGDLSMYGFANAVTRFAQDVNSYDRSTELESIGYDILTMNPRTWRNLQVVEAA